MKDAKMKQLMDLAEQLDKYVSNFPYQVNVLSETHTLIWKLVSQKSLYLTTTMTFWY